MSTMHIPGVPDDPRRRAWLLAVGYIVGFLLLDWVSFIHPFQGLNITPWNPQPALAVALLMRQPRWLWLVWLGLVVAELAVRGVPGNWFVMLSATAALTLSYAAIARAAQARLDRSLLLATRRDLYWFTAIVTGGALLSATIYVATVAVGAVDSSSSFWEAVARYWVGDAVGLVITLPMLVMFMDRGRRGLLFTTLRRRDGWLVAGTIVLLLVIVFGRTDGDLFKFFYLLFLPVVWASARFGLPGAVLAAAFTQLGLIVAIQFAADADLTVFELQVLMTAVTMTGLMLGVAVDERERAAAELKGSLRLAAAGQMAAALAHELSQPLTALNSYAEASQALVSLPGLDEATRLRGLTDVSQRMVADAMRASSVVKRLRDFFRSGSTQLQPTALRTILGDTVAASLRRAEALGIALRLDMEDGLPDMLMDPVQIGVVLRNLVANGLEAASLGSPPREVALRASRQKGGVLVEVLDNGAGVSEEKLATLFEPCASDKPGGMGVGLSICRAIVEAHGGALWARAGTSGHFCFTLPIDEPPSPGKRRAP